MPAQAAHATATQSSVPWLAALQNVAAVAAIKLSPVRLAMGCSLAGQPDLQRAAFANAWPLGAIPLIIVMILAVLLIC